MTKYNVKVRADALIEVQGVVAPSMEDAVDFVKDLCLMKFTKRYAGMELEYLGGPQEVVGVEKADAWEGI